MKLIIALLLSISTLAFAKQGSDFPGIAIGVVRAGEAPIIFTYGVKSTAGKDPIDGQTLFPIASCTKAFTCHVVSGLVEEGRLSWDETPEISLPSDRITLRHMATHTTGTPRSDGLWHNVRISQGEVLKALKTLPQKRAPGEKFEYSNLMYVGLGQVVEQAAGHDFEEELQRQILEPLGMESTHMTPLALTDHPNSARGHRLKKGRLVEVPYGDTRAVAPAGAICSNVEDMVRWVDFQLTQNPPLLSQESLEEMRTPHVLTSNEAYGLGWFITEYQGYTEVKHGGGIRGFSSLVTFIPSEGVGIVLLTNCEDYTALVKLSHLIYDHLLSVSLTTAES